MVVLSAMAVPQGEAPCPLPPIAANDNVKPPHLSPSAQAALKRIARLVGRQIAREVSAALQAANDNDARPDEEDCGG